MVKFFEGVGKMLSAVVSGRKGDICNVQSTVAKEKSGLFHTLAVNVSIDGAAVFFCKKCLEIRLVDPCICGDVGDRKLLQIMFVNIAESFFQVSTSLRTLTETCTEGKFCKHAAEKQEKEKFFFHDLTGAMHAKKGNAI